MRLFLLLFLPVVLATGALGAFAADMKLADSGKTPYCISVAEDATEPEQNAAEELKFYLDRMTGVRFDIVKPEQASGKHIIAVGPGAAKKLMPNLPMDFDELGNDGIIIKTDKTRLVLTGAEGSTRGTLYAVYTFLEDVCGVRWWTSDASYIPGKPELSIAAQDVRYVPVFRYRETLYRNLNAGVFPKNTIAEDTRSKFLARSKLNGHFDTIPARWGGSYYIIGWCHTFYAFLPPEKYFDQHPEWFSEIKGKRVHQNAQLCCTNDEMIAELAKNVIAAIDSHPSAGIVSVSQNDWGGNCQCVKCKALDEAEGSSSASLLYCVNKVAEEVKKKYPNFLVETLAYHYTRKPPKTIRPHDNVLMRLAVIERSGIHPINSKMNAKLMEDLQGWKSAAPNLFLWDYTADMLAPFTTHPNLYVFSPDARTYAASNVVGVFNEGNHYAGDARGDFDELKIYVMSHVLWNPKVNQTKLIGEFLDGYYGDAAPALQEYLDLVHKKSRNVWLHSWRTNGDASWMDLNTMNAATELFDRAEDAVWGNPVLLNRVQRARLQLDHQWIIRYGHYAHVAKNAKKPFKGPEDIVAAGETFLQRVLKYEGTNIRSEGANTFDDYAIKIRMRTDYIANPAPPPEQFADLPKGHVIDIQETEMTIHPGAEIVADPLASNNYAAKMDPSVLSWQVQFNGIGDAVEPGKWQVFANIRCEKVKDSGIAISGGIYDNVIAKNLVGLSLYLEDNAVAKDNVDPEIDQDKTIVPAKGAGDGKYQLYDLGTHKLDRQNYVWFGTTGGVSPDTVKAIYIDRVIFVKAK